jgi:hypothetical protein
VLQSSITGWARSEANLSLASALVESRQVLNDAHPCVAKIIEKQSSKTSQNQWLDLVNSAFLEGVG